MVWALDETGTVDASLLCKNYEHNKRLALIEQKEMSGNWTRRSGGGTPSPRGGRTEQLRKLGKSKKAQESRGFSPTTAYVMIKS